MNAKIVEWKCSFKLDLFFKMFSVVDWWLQYMFMSDNILNFNRAAFTIRIGWLSLGKMHYHHHKLELEAFCESSDHIEEK
ncbi:hypothetical protein RIF29_13473 [Crotalaria pallida]|uniref:Uncharacterized protein n=1 Tax=Crotalaria pallida TaxID=3830 RepID=A0AAN9P2V4_CROPI